MKGRVEKAVILIIAAFCLQTSVYADGKTINGAYSFYSDRQLANYCEGAGWKYGNIYSYFWEDDTHNLIRRSSVGYQYDAYEDILEALIKELKSNGDTEFDSNEGNGESSFGHALGNIPDYSGYVNEVNRLVDTALAECGEGETPEYSDCVKYNSDLGLQDGRPWSASFVCWCADRCGLLNETFGPARALCSDLYDDLTGKGYCSYNCSTIKQWGGEEYLAVPGDIVFWRGTNDSEYTRTGIVTETGKDYIVITQGNTASGHVLPITYTKTSAEFSQGRIIHVTYPNSVFNGDAVKAVIGFLQALNFSNSAILGILGNMDAESGLIPYRCENDQNRSNAYSDSYSYTKAVDAGEISKTEFISAQTGNFGPGYGLVQFSYGPYKESVYDLAQKRGTSVSDPETQLIALVNIWKAESVTIDKTYSIAGRDDSITRSFMRSLGYTQYDTATTFDLLMKVPDTDEGARIACNIVLSIFEKPRTFNLEDRIARMGKYSSELSRGGVSDP